MPGSPRPPRPPPGPPSPPEIAPIFEAASCCAWSMAWLTAAVNEGLRAAQELQQSKLGGLTGGMDLGSLGLGF